MSWGNDPRPGGHGGVEGTALDPRAWTQQLLPQVRVQHGDTHGQPATAQVLDALPSGWETLHDRRCPDARLPIMDHLVIGPTGVFVVASVTWSGTATVVDGVVRLDGHPREASVASAAEAALPLARLVGLDGGDVQAVLCIRGAGVLDDRSRDVLVCSPDTIGDVLGSRPHVLDAGQVAALAFRLDLELYGTLAPVITERSLPRLLPALSPPPHLLTGAPGRPAPVVADPGPWADEATEPRRELIPTQPTHPADRGDRSRRALVQRQRERERSRRARLARRIANAVLLVVVLVTFGPAASSVLSQGLSALAPATVLPAPSVPASPTACPSLQGEPSACAPEVAPGSGSRP